MKNLKKYYLSKGYTRASFAEALNVSEKTVYRWEKGALSKTAEKYFYLCFIYGQMSNPELFIDGKLPRHKSLSYAKLAHKTGVSVAQVYKLKDGNLGKFALIHRITTALGLRASKLLYHP